ncbi:conserved protein of unknown function [Ruminococcaceae bacterium BL-6]|nr:conserved protein of unknown function [Ruminococcaceae bacterium BL-6]
MRAMDSMAPKLKALGLYRLSGETLVDAELQACAAGLDLVYEALEELDRENFIATAVSEGLALRETMFGQNRSYLPAEDRRTMLLYRGAVTVNDCTRESIERAVRAAGLECRITEKTAEKKVYLNCLRLLDETVGREELTAQASLFLPAHLEWEFDFSIFTWDCLDALDETFDERDAPDLSWDERENG